MLKGCECDPNNPIRLQDCFILDAIEHSYKARKDFNALYPALFPCEQERLDLLIRDNPMLARLSQDHISNSDQFQAKMNQIPVRTVGPLGGRRLPVGRVVQHLQLPPHLAPRRQPTKCY